MQKPDSTRPTRVVRLLQLLHHGLPVDILDSIWRDVQVRIQEPEYAPYRGARIFFSSKNTKTVYKGDSLAAMWAKFQVQLNHIFDFQYLNEDHFWLDLGKETVCQE